MSARVCKCFITRMLLIYHSYVYLSKCQALEQSFPSQGSTRVFKEKVRQDFYRLRECSFFSSKKKGTQQAFDRPRDESLKGQSHGGADTRSSKSPQVHHRIFLSFPSAQSSPPPVPKRLEIIDFEPFSPLLARRLLGDLSFTLGCV